MAAPCGVGMLIKKVRSKLSVSNVAGGKVELFTRVKINNAKIPQHPKSYTLRGYKFGPRQVLPINQDGA